MLHLHRFVFCLWTEGRLQTFRYRTKTMPFHVDIGLCHSSSSSHSIHSIVTSEVGKPENAYAYFRQGLRLDLDDFKNNTAGGLDLACLRSTWMAVVNGFAGMRDYPAGAGRPRRSPALRGPWGMAR